MALLKWSDDEEEKQDDFLTPRPVQAIKSVQESWQPTQTTTDENGNEVQKQPEEENYLMSDQKAAIDDELRQRKAAEEAARQEAARQAEAARAAQAAAAYQASQVQPDQPQKPNVDAAKNDNGWKQYYGAEFEKEKKGLNFLQRLIDNGQASSRAESAARRRYNSQIIDKAWDSNGNVLDPNAVYQAQNLASYNSALANDNANKGRALGNIVGANRTGDNFTPANIGSAVETLKRMSIYDAAFGVDDTTKFDGNDVTKFIGDMGKDILLTPIVGTDKLIEAGAGSGTDDLTGLERELNTLERGGRGISGLIDLVTPFIGGSGKLVTEGAKILPKASAGAIETISSRLLPIILKDAGKEGSINSAQALGDFYGYGDTIIGQDGKLDLDKAKDLSVAMAQSFLAGSAMSGVNSGGAYGVSKLRNRGDVKLASEDSTVNVEPVAQDSNVSFETQLNNSRLGQPTNLLENANLTPVRSNQTPAVADGIARTTPADPTLIEPDTTSKLEPTPIDKLTPEQATPELTPVETAPDVAEGVVRTPQTAETNTIPTVRADEVRQLQDSRAGTNQAEEAVINQKLQEAEAVTPAIDETSPKSKAGIKDTDDYDIAADKLEEAYDKGEITEEEYQQLDRELFDAAEGRGDVIAQNAGDPIEKTPQSGKAPKTEGVAPKPPKTDPLESLKAEARKYKSA